MIEWKQKLACNRCGKKKIFVVTWRRKWGNIRRLKLTTSARQHILFEHKILMVFWMNVLRLIAIYQHHRDSFVKTYSVLWGWTELYFQLPRILWTVYFPIELSSVCLFKEGCVLKCTEISPILLSKEERNS